MNLLLFLVIVSSFLSLSSLTWWCAWLSMEFSLVWLYPILSLEFSGSKKSSLWSFFLFQSVSSVLLFLCFMATPSFIDLNTCQFTFWISLFLLLLKMGFPPFHSWYLELCDSVSSTGFILINTVVKLPPLWLCFGVYSLAVSSHVMLMVLCLSSLFSLSGLSSFSYRRMMIYSSFVNYVWGLASMGLSVSAFVTFFLNYFIPFLTFWFMLSNFVQNPCSTLPAGKLKESLSVVFMASWLSLSGLPPFGLFFAKALVAYELSCLSDLHWVLTLCLAFVSTLMMWIYLSLGFAIFLWSSSMFILSKKEKSGWSTLTLVYTLLVASIMTPLALF
uniref:NADH-ubiquinone oxidoreductase chain 2 n=1 Tax=Pthirus pubis TaxID=121228 RepID=C0ILV3_PTHPU|nr:NADH dehydrogenase subunit 2 [Pthirus pubis]